MKTVFSDLVWTLDLDTSLLMSLRLTQKYCKTFQQSHLQLKIDFLDIILGLTIWKAHIVKYLWRLSWCYFNSEN